jgi:hypothetical protein
VNTDYVVRECHIPHCWSCDVFVGCVRTAANFTVRERKLWLQPPGGVELCEHVTPDNGGCANAGVPSILD